MDASKFYLGSLCKRNHNYDDTGQSLRTVKKGECLECRRMRRAKVRASKKDLSGYYIGGLCKQGHDYNNTGQSLREKKTGDCLECHKLRSYGNKRSPYYCPDYRKYRTWLKNPRISPTIAELVEKEAIRRHKENRYQWDENVREQKKAWYRNKYQNNRTQEIAKVRNWKQNNSKKVSLQNHRRKNRVDRQCDGTITPDYLANLKAQADYCSYCKSRLYEDNKTIDHAVPIALGGLHSVNNIVVCCENCNLRKGYMPLNEWLEKPGIINPF